MSTEQLIKKHGFKVAPKNGYVFFTARAYGYCTTYEGLWLGLGDFDPLERLAELYPYCTDFVFYDIPEKMKKGFSFGVGRPQSKRDR